MFSSISNYCSPKKVLASYLSKSLAEFFCVDPERVETNLIHDAKVVLNEIEIKQRRIGGLLVSGVVNQIEFSWVWDAASLITDVTLTIKGVSIYLNIVNEEDAGETKSPETKQPSEFAESSETREGKGTPPPDWKAKYLQQIIDHLTLVVTDVTITIHLNKESQVALQAKDLELKTLKQINVKNSETSLLQSITLRSIEAWMEIDSDSSSNCKYQILEPFGYRASIQRISGRRFLDGVLSGLFVQGKESDDETHTCSTIRVHAGTKQISGLSSLQQVLLSVGSKGAAAMATANSDEKIMEDHLFPSTMADIKSVFHLPFKSIEVVLENDTNIRLADCALRYCTDGTELSVDCTGGIWVDETPLSKNNRMIIDLASSELVLHSLCLSTNINADGGDIFYDVQSSTIDTINSDALQNDSETKHPCRLDLSLEIFQKLYLGIQAILPQCEEAMARIEDDQVKGPSSSTTSPWVIKSIGEVIFRFSGSSDIWVEVAANSPKLTQGTFESKCPFSFECKNIGIHSSAGFSIEIPEIKTDNDVLVIKDRIAANVDSMETVTSLHNLWVQMSDIVNYKTLKDSKDVVSPIDISLSGIDFCMKVPTLGTVKMFDIQGCGVNWKLKLMQVTNVGGICAEARSLAFTLDTSKTTVLVQELSKLSHGNRDYLSAPLTGTKLVLEKDTLFLMCKDVQMVYPEQEITDLETQQTETSNNDLDLASFPFSIHFTAEHLLAKSSDTSMSVEAVDVWARPTPEPSLDLTFQSLTGSFADRMKSACGKFQTSLKFNPHSAAMDDSHEQLVIVPRLGKLLSATISLNDIGDFSIADIGHLAKPIDALSIIVDGTIATTRCDTILFCSETTDTMDTHQSVSNTSFNLPLSLSFEVKRLVVQSEFGLGKPGVCFDFLQVNLSPNNESIAINVSCNCIQGRQGHRPNQADFAIKGVKLDARKDLKNDAYFGIHEISLSMKEIYTLRIPGVLNLSKPLLNPIVKFQNGSLEVICGLLHLCSTSPGNQSKDEMNKDRRKPTASELLPIPFCIAVHQVIVDSSATETTQQSSVQCDQVFIEYTPALKSTLRSLRIKCSSLQAKSGANSCQMNGLILSPKWRDVYDEIDDSDDILYVPYLGLLSEASIKIDEISEFNAEGQGRLCQPLLNSTMSYGNQVLSVNLAAVYFEMGSKTELSTTPKSMSSLNLSLVLAAKSIFIELDKELEGSELSLEEIKVTMKPPKDSTKGLLSSTFKFLQVVTASNIGFVANSINTDICLEKFHSQTSDNISVPACGIVSEGTLTLSSITKIIIPGVGKIDKEIIDTSIVYEKGGFLLNFGNIEWACCNSFEKSTLSSPSKGAIDHSLFKYPIQVIVQSMEVKNGLDSLRCRGKLDLSHQSDPFDESLKFAFQLDSFSGNGFQGASIAALGISLIVDINVASPYTTATPEPIPTIYLSAQDKTSTPESIPIPGFGSISSAILTFSEVSELSIPGLAYLRSPSKFLSFRFERGTVVMDCPSVCVQRRTPQQTNLQDAQDHPPFDLLYKVNISIQSLQISETLWPSQSQREILCSHFDLALEHVFARMSASSPESPGAGIYFKCNNFRSNENSTVIEIPNLSASGLVQFDQLNKIGNLAVGMKKVQLAADFSSSNWSSSLEEKSPTVMELPFAVIPKFELTLKCVGTLVNIDNATIACDKFEGDAMATLSSVGEHYIQVAKSRIPYLLAKTEIAGVNVCDSVGMMAGKVLTNTSVIGATVGVASRDMIGSAVTQGKAQRGASSADGYKFGDFTRGVASSFRNAANSGTQMRGDDTYQVGDFISGSAKAVEDYTCENRVRLAGAGGSAAGMIAGAALLGPVGFVAGSLLGSSAAQSSARAISGDPKKEVKDTEDSQYSTCTNNTPHQLPDLLSPTDPFEQDTTTNLRSDTCDGNSDSFLTAQAIPTEAELIGEVATADHRAVMVQAQLADPFSSSIPRPANTSTSTRENVMQRNTTSSTSFESLSQTIPHGGTIENGTQNRNLHQRHGHFSHSQPQVQSQHQAHYQPQYQSQTRAQYQAQAQNQAHYQAQNQAHYQAPAQYQTQYQAQTQHHNTYVNQARSQPQGQAADNNINPEQEQYRFGDVTRGIIERGRQLDGREENSGYKFGDFTRGLFR